MVVIVLAVLPHFRFLITLGFYPFPSPIFTILQLFLRLLSYGVGRGMWKEVYCSIKFPIGFPASEGIYLSVSHWQEAPYCCSEGDVSCF